MDYVATELSALRQGTQNWSLYEDMIVLLFYLVPKSVTRNILIAIQERIGTVQAGLIALSCQAKKGSIECLINIKKNTEKKMPNI